MLVQCQQVFGVVMCESVAAGLDARAAAIVMKAVKNTVRTGRTVVCTIHQPSLEIFQVLYQQHIHICRL